MTKLVRLLVQMSMLILLFTLNVVVAFADEPHDNGGGIATAEGAGAGAPVGSNISDQGFENGFGNENSNAFGAIANNPLCPLH